MSSQRTTLIIPVENQVRELDAKLLLSCVAAERGHPVVLGSRAFVHFKVASIERGVYLAKSMRTLSDRMFGILRDLGHEIVAWDEEGLVRPPNAQYYARRLSPVALGRVAALFAWGPDDAQVFRDFPGYTGTPIYVTGNPRIDMMRPELRSYFDDEVAALRERYGRFVLVNTNFSHANHFVARLQPNTPGGEKTNAYQTGLAEHRSLLFLYFQEMVPYLSRALPDHTILVRPHPTERHDPWLKIADEHANVRVASEGNVIPRLMACDALIQNACTTAVEAALLDTPAITYEPVASDRYDVALTRDLTHRAAGLDELGDLTGAIAAGELATRAIPGRAERIARHIAALDGRLAAERMVDALGELGYADSVPLRTSRLRTAKEWLHTHLRTGEKLVNMRRAGHRNAASYHAHRFPDITADALAARVERLGRQLGRFGALRVRETSRHVFRIEP